jgi:hypothetical protein
MSRRAEGASLRQIAANQRRARGSFSLMFFRRSGDYQAGKNLSFTQDFFCVESVRI